MKTPLYEGSVSALKALLATRSFVFCDLYTVQTFATNAGLYQLLFATGDLDVTYGGMTWTHGAPPIDQSAETGSSPTAHWKTGLDVDTWTFVVMPRAVHPITGAANPDTIAGIPWQQACAGGVLDGATVIIDRAYLTAWPSGTSAFAAPVTPVGVVNIFHGKVSGVDVGRSRIGIAVSSHLHFLDVSFPRNVFQAPCAHTLFDAGCQLNAETYAVNGTVAAGSTANTIYAALASPTGSGTFALGRVVMTSGANATFQRSVRSYTAGATDVLQLLAPFSFPLEVGDTFTAYPGCDKTRASCAAFANSVNFGGQPFIPAPEMAA